MARTGMAAIITLLREMTETAVTDYTVNGVQYWTDDQLQMYLDRYRHTHKRIRVVPEPNYIDGNTTYTEYSIPTRRRLEQADGWRLYDSSGTDVASDDYSVNFDANRITFDADTQNTAYYVDYRAYDLRATAADIWHAKAAHVSKRVNFAADNHRVDAAQVYQHCMQMAAHYGGGTSMRLFVRVDEQ